jgi:dihydroxyacetone kinase
MKKFINRPENAVEEMLRSFAVLSPNTARLSGH